MSSCERVNRRSSLEDEFDIKLCACDGMYSIHPLAFDKYSTCIRHYDLELVSNSSRMPVGFVIHSCWIRHVAMHSSTDNRMHSSHTQDTFLFCPPEHLSLCTLPLSLILNSSCIFLICTSLRSGGILVVIIIITSIVHVPMYACMCAYTVHGCMISSSIDTNTRM